METLAWGVCLYSHEDTTQHLHSISEFWCIPGKIASQFMFPESFCRSKVEICCWLPAVLMDGCISHSSLVFWSRKYEFRFYWHSTKSNFSRDNHKFLVSFPKIALLMTVNKQEIFFFIFLWLKLSWQICSSTIKKLEDVIAQANHCILLCTLKKQIGFCNTPECIQWQWKAYQWKQ